jgi:predicted DNA-binding antitoxin AbrB/MazE fold protein
MQKAIDPIYENGLIELVDRLFLPKTHRKKVTVQTTEGRVVSIKALMEADRAVVRIAFPYR